MRGILVVCQYREVTRAVILNCPLTVVLIMYIAYDVSLQNVYYKVHFIMIINNLKGQVGIGVEDIKTIYF